MQLYLLAVSFHYLLCCAVQQIYLLSGLEPPQFEQPQYNLCWRDRFETEYHPLYQAPYNMGTTIWSPLASGLLTGKYNDEIPAGSRLTTKNYEWLKDKLNKWHADGTITKVRELSEFAKTRFNCTVGQLALAWCVRNKNVSTVLLGATKPEQLHENLAAIQIVEQITDEDMKKIDEIMKNKPTPYGGYGGAGMRSIERPPCDLVK